MRTHAVAPLWKRRGNTRLIELREKLLADCPSRQPAAIHNRCNYQMQGGVIIAGGRVNPPSKLGRN